MITDRFEITLGRVNIDVYIQQYIVYAKKTLEISMHMCAIGKYENSKCPTSFSLILFSLFRLMENYVHFT